MTAPAIGDSAPAPRDVLRLGFLGTGWIGRNRLQGLLEATPPGLRVEVAALCDPSTEALEQAAALAPTALLTESLDVMLAQGLDGVVIATPSAQHAPQSIRALGAGAAVFCQKPLGRNATEVRSVVDAARRANRLLGCDFSYRFTAGMRAIKELVERGALGRIHAADLVFHNAYGPDKPWFYDACQSGGGCVMDLGSHLVDLALWLLDFPEVVDVTSALSRDGEPLHDARATCENHGYAMLRLASGTVVRVACSWNLHAGQDARISADFFGTRGGAAMHNLDGSFYDFVAERFVGTGRELVAAGPDNWGPRALTDWVARLSCSDCFDASAERLCEVAKVLDRIYAGCRA